MHKRDIGKIETPKIETRYEGGCPENEERKIRKLKKATNEKNIAIMIYERVFILILYNATL